jgi:recombination protein RecR
MLLPAPLQNMMDALARLPGIGPKSASRLTFFLLNAPDELVQNLLDALQALKGGIARCPLCYNIMAAGRTACEICSSAERDAKLVCVVEEPLDVLAIERIGVYTGRYHVLGGALSPIEGIGPEDLTIRQLMERVRSGGIEEVIIATNPSMEGDATAMFLQRQIAGQGIRVTRLARGLPVGGDLEYTDQSTLLRALMGRQDMGD